ncbi:MAG: PilZ domain-containing protein [Candidatus Omnitrophica bacterium]|nr:PilZ domain-containing protein [Candidatus Omnitrophota bacterium]
MPRFIEKRKFPRLDVKIPLRYKDFSGAAQPELESFSKNLSQGGISFNTHRFVPLSSHLVLDMNVPAFADPIRAITKITWIRKLAAANRYVVGGQFVEIKRNDVANLQKVLNVLRVA